MDKCIYPNKKPWKTKAVQNLLRERNTAFRSGDGVLYRTARGRLKKSFREANIRRTEVCFQSNTFRQVWQGVRYIPNYPAASWLTVVMPHLGRKCATSFPAPRWH